MFPRKIEFFESIALKVGVIPAIVHGFFYDFDRYIQCNDAMEEHMKEFSAFHLHGRLYRSITIEKLQEEIPFLTIYQLNGAIRKLEKAGLLVSMKMGSIEKKTNEDGFMKTFNQTKAYAIP